MINSRFGKNLLIVMLVTLCGMTAYEVTKQILYPEISIWLSHIYTIIFSTFIATSSAYIVLRKYEKKNEQLNSEIKQREHMKNELVLVNNLSKSLISSSLDIIIAVDIDRNIIEFNEAAQKAYGYSLEEVLGKPIDFIYANTEDSVMVHDSMLDKGQFVGEVLNKNRNGETFPSFLSAAILREPGSKLSGYMGISRDISERKKFEEALELAATTDRLTGIYNRHKFEEMLDIEIRRAKRYKSPLSLIMFDLDHFKTINDKHGHQVGDRVLKALADLVKTHIRKTDHFARWGGEEFIILSPEITQEVALELAGKIRVLIEEHSFEKSEKITISGGVTEFKEDDTFDTMIQRVDDALYRVKNKGRNKIEIGH